MNSIFLNNYKLWNHLDINIKLTFERLNSRCKRHSGCFCVRVSEDGTQKYEVVSSFIAYTPFENWRNKPKAEENNVSAYGHYLWKDWCSWSETEKSWHHLWQFKFNIEYQTLSSCQGSFFAKQKSEWMTTFYTTAECCAMCLCVNKQIRLKISIHDRKLLMKHVGRVQEMVL